MIVTPAKAGAQTLFLFLVLGTGLRRYDGSVETGGYVYIMASGRNGTLYIGVTSDLIGRVWQHREDVTPGFTKKYGCKLLVWYEAFGDIELAIRREKQMKEWKRLWKLRVIEEMNPDWEDLYESLF